jgi:hypothetical protein
MFRTLRETTGIQVLSMRNPIPRDVLNRKWRLRSRRSSVCCRLRSTNQMFLFSGPSGHNFRVIPPMSAALGVSVCSSRQQGVFVKGKVQHVRMFQKKTCNERDSLLFAFPRNLCAMRVVNWRYLVWLCGGGRSCEGDWKWSPVVFTPCSFFTHFGSWCILVLLCVFLSYVLHTPYFAGLPYFIGPPFIVTLHLPGLGIILIVGFGEVAECIQENQPDSS